MSQLARRIAEHIERTGPLRFDEFMAHALYDATDGFYSAGGHAGRRGDFITSPEVGPLFGAVVGRALDTWWDELGRPDPFVVVEAGAGVGTLARTVLAGSPACLAALTYVLVEQSAALRSRQGEHLSLTSPALALPPRSTDDDGIEIDVERSLGGSAGGSVGSGPRFVSLAELPALRIVGVVLANELLDNLVFGLAQRTQDGWSEVRIGLADPGGRGSAGVDGSDGADRVDGVDGFVEVLVPASDELGRTLDRLVPDAPVGARVPVQRAAVEWLRRALERIERGRLVLIDYAGTSEDFATRPQGEWLRTYRGHERGVDPVVAPGLQDITCEVAIDQLAQVRRPALVRDQADFLRSHGIEELVEEGRRTWHERAHIGDLAALTARSRVTEAEALTEPTGLGAFQVMEWHLP